MRRLATSSSFESLGFDDEEETDDTELLVNANDETEELANDCIELDEDELDMSEAPLRDDEDDELLTPLNCKLVCCVVKF